MYQMELTLVVRRSRASNVNIYDALSMDKVTGTNLTEILGQFLVVLARVHGVLIDECKRDNEDFDEDIPF
jgi:hypothetical protein